MASTLSKQSALARERERDAFRLRADGLTYEQIAVRLGYARANGAHRACMRAYRRLNAEVNEEAEVHRRLDLERLDRMIAVLLPALEQGDWEAGRTLLGVLKRRADMLGMDAPTRIAPTNPEGTEAYGADLAAATAALERKLAAAIAARDAYGSCAGSEPARGGGDELPLAALGSAEPASA